MSRRAKEWLIVLIGIVVILIGIFVLYEYEKNTSYPPFAETPYLFGSTPTSTTSTSATPTGTVTATVDMIPTNQTRLAYLFPNLFDQGAGDPSPSTTGGYVHFLSIPFHQSNKVLRVYINCSTTPEGNPLDLIKQGNTEAFSLCADQGAVRLVVYNPVDQSQEYLGAIPPIFGSNSGALFVPLAVSGDDRSIILDAWMGSPGAGGGEVDYGYALMPITPAAKAQTVLDNFTTIATRQAIFYNTFSNVVYVAEGTKTAPCAQPGPLNDAAIRYRDLADPSVEQTLIEEPSTTYSLNKINEGQKELYFVATAYANLPKDTCPQDVFPTSTLISTTTSRTAVVPE